MLSLALNNLTIAFIQIFDNFNINIPEFLIELRSQPSDYVLSKEEQSKNKLR